jgi:hypothetical protein
LAIKTKISRLQELEEGRVFPKKAFALTISKSAKLLAFGNKLLAIY